MKRAFLTLYDYETGGAWQFIVAQSEEEIRARYPELQVVDRPPWMSNELMEDLRFRTVDLGDEDDPFLRALREGRSQ